MSNEKWIVYSKTFQGIIVALSPLVARWLGVTEDQISQGAAQVVQIFGLLWAFYGNVKRKETVTLLPP